MYSLISPINLILASEGVLIWCNTCKVHYRPEDASSHGHNK